MKFKTAIASLIAVSLTGCAVPSQVTKIKPEVTSTSHIKDGSYNCVKHVWTETRWDPHAKGKLIPIARKASHGFDTGNGILDLRNGIITIGTDTIPAKSISTSQLEAILVQNKVLRNHGEKLYSAVQLQIIDSALYQNVREVEGYNQTIKELIDEAKIIERDINNNLNVEQRKDELKTVVDLIKRAQGQREWAIKNNGISKILSYDTTGKWHILVAYYDNVTDGKQLSISASNSQTWNTIDFSCQVNTK